ncbi:MAG: NYN domain-containing protein [Chitinophagaceae bacterium]|nr:NYN domain-containing protein [Chitinophagaceae bacterium]
MNGLHIFIDNSNLYIEAQRVARESFFYDDELVIRMRVSYGGLLDVIANGRELGEAVLVGARPPQNDSLWNKLKQYGIQPRIFDRSMFSGKEKRVDAELINAIRDTLEDNPTPGTIAIVAGDQDYIPTLERCLKKNWKVELYFWEQASSQLRNLSGIEFHNLDQHFDQITFRQKNKE